MAQDLEIYSRYVTAGSSSNQIYQDCIQAGSSSQDATETAYPTNTNPTNLGTTYLSSATVQKTYSTNTYAVLNPTSADLHTRGQRNYWVTGSITIPSAAITFTTASWANVKLNSLVSASIATGSIAKVSITSSYFTPLFNSNINDSNDVKAFSVLAYNGVVSTLNGFNEYSSSTFNNVSESFAVIYVSASRASMGSVVTNDLNVSIGTVQNRS